MSAKPTILTLDHIYSFSTQELYVVKVDFHTPPFRLFYQIQAKD